MSRSWTPDELRVASKWMKEHGFMDYEEFCNALNDYEAKRQHYWNYLEKLRRSGVTNMFGAVPYLVEEFGLDRDEAEKILIEWMENYNPDDYDI